MEELRSLLASDHRQTLEFFFVHLQDVVEAPVDRQELLYNASVLAHYAQVSTCATGDMPTPSSLGRIFDQYVLDQSLADDAEMMESAGAQCLLLAGFFADQMRVRHNVRWYAGLGAGFYRRAADCARSPKTAHVMWAMAEHFEPWRQRHERLSRELRDQPYLLDRN
ncbi:MAG TPA: hypothetical protein VL263_21055 [Vicinamibacterales bacterium]|jgi:hypothetical protein|nr:hypothetical protein [Vicinamibacterales bacterium]